VVAIEREVAGFCKNRYSGGSVGREETNGQAIGFEPPASKELRYAHLPPGPEKRDDRKLELWPTLDAVAPLS